MGDRENRLIPVDTKLTNPLGAWRSVGLGINGFVGVPIDTAISEGDGLISGFDVHLGYAANANEMYAFYLKMMWGSSEGKMLQSYETGFPTERRSVLLGLGKENKFYEYYSRSGRTTISLSNGSKYLLGAGKTTISDPLFTDETGVDTFDIGQELSVSLKAYLGSNVSLGLSPFVYYGVNYDEDGSEFNRLNLMAGASLELALEPESLDSGEKVDRPAGVSENVLEIYKRIHAIAMGIEINSALSDQQQAIDEFGFGTGGAPEGPMAQQVPTFRAISSTAKGLTNSTEIPLRTEDLFWVYCAADLITGPAFLASDSDAGKAGGVADFLRGTGLLTNALLGINTVKKRQQLNDDEITKRKEISVLSNYLLNSAILAIGEATDTPFLAQGAGQANLSVAATPYAIPEPDQESEFLGGYDATGGRAALGLQTHLKSLPLATGAMVLYAPDDITIATYLAAELDLKYVYAQAGLSNEITFNNDNGSSAVGGVLGAGAKLGDKVILDAKLFVDPTEEAAKWNAIASIGVALP